MRTQPLVLCLAFAAFACSRPSSNDAPATQAVTSASALPTASAKAAAPEDAARRVVTTWSDALDKHDLGALDRIYAANVKYYGKDIAKSTVVAAKKRALAAAPTFHQSIVGPVDVTKDGDAFVATFTKRSGTADMKDVKAKIVVQGGLVREESDAPSDARAASATAKAGGESACEAAAYSAVSNLPEVKKLLADDEKEIAKLKDGRSVGGMGPMPDEGGGFSGSIGVHHAERYEAQVWYTVDRAGVLSVTVQGLDVAVPAATKATVQRACKTP